ncbi:ionotropic receptor 25a-like [Mytilus galloprovincialis]|uniref:ionotropic receptor 25a-like n=1 Tax=Mytilus galloprovincialis TaxID=29158 RepID=UPI003F7B76B1
MAIAILYRGFLLVCLIIGNRSQYFVAVVEDAKLMQNKLIGRTLEWGGKIKIVESHDQNQTLAEVCEHLKTGATALIDMSAPNVGLLIRSFARTVGLPYITVVDPSTLQSKDYDPDLHIGVEPPGSTMFRVIPDIVKHGSLTKIAILYDQSFDLHTIAKRILTGVPAQHLYQEIAQGEGLAEQMKKLKDIGTKIFILVSDENSADSVLGEASKQELMDEAYNWFVITKGHGLTCSKCRLGKSATVIHINGNESYNYTSRDAYLDFVKIQLRENFFTIYGFNIDEAFMYDLRMILDDVSTRFINATPIIIPDCNTVSLVRNQSRVDESRRIVEPFKTAKRTGVYGNISYRNGMLRQDVQLTINRIILDNLNKNTLGTWNEQDHISVNGKLTKEVGKKKYRVVIVPKYEPFVIKLSDNSKKNVTRADYDGYCLDLLDAIADTADFEYEIEESPDGLVGAMSDDGSWDGVIKHLMDRKADIAVGPISVMAERENVVDFTVPYYDLVGLTILMKKPKFDYKITKFIEVLDNYVWLCIIAAFFLFSGLLWAFDKFSPYSYQNDETLWDGQGPEPRVFSFKEGIWFCMMSLTPQGGGEAPRALSGRLIAATWWLFGFIVIATYTANLAAFLTVSRMDEPIKSLDDLSSQYKIQYAPMNGSTGLVYFKRMAEIEQKFYTIWKQMSLNDSLDAVQRAKLAVWDYPVSNKYTKLWETMQDTGFPDTLEEATKRVISGDFAYIGDAAENKFQTLTKCDLWEVGEEFSRKPFAFAVQEGSPLRNILSNAILQLLNQRKLETLKHKWWTNNQKKKTCPDIENESDGISIKNIGGVFLVIAVGTALSLICLAFEFYWYKYRPQQDGMRYNVKRNQSKASLTTTPTATTTLSNGNGSLWANNAPDFVPEEEARSNGMVHFELNGQL